jgi:uncharacterized protein (TIGR03000 family)
MRKPRGRGHHQGDCIHETATGSSRPSRARACLPALRHRAKLRPTRWSRRRRSRIQRRSGIQRRSRVLGYGPGIGIGIGGYGGGYYGGGYYSPYNSYSSPYYSNGYAYSVPAYADGANPGSYQSFYPSSSAVQQGLDTATNIHVRVPASAQVMFDGTQTTQTGTDRMFTTGPLDPTKNYSYQITANWTENGNERRESRTVRIIPGQSVDVDFMRAAPLPQPKVITVAQ